MSEASPKKFDIAVLRRVFGYAAPYKKKFYLSVVLAILLAVITPVRPLLIQVTVNKYIIQSVAHMVVNITLIQIGLILLET
ncbi:MAG: ABC transporter ATP-binding protein, partial [Chitinophagaceae bacterium]